MRPGVRLSLRPRSAALAVATVLALALWFSVALAGPAVVRDGAVAPGVRPVVLIVHGRGLLDQDSAYLRVSWRRALQRGESAVTGTTVLGDDDVRLVWYADLLDAESSATDGRGAKGDEGRGTTQKRYEALASRCDDVEDLPPARMGVDPDLGVVASLVGMVLEAAVPMFEGPGGTELRALAGDLSYFADARRRCAVAQRLESALGAARREGRPVILVAHSLGSIVTWDMFARTRTEARPAVERLVTIGAPLGSRDLRALVFGARARGTLMLPRGVKSWVNVVNPADPLAAPLGDSTLAAGLRDVTTSSASTGDTHDVVGYLRDPVTARAILEAYCAAAGTKPVGCEKL